MVISAYGYTRNEDMLLFDPILQEVRAQFRSDQCAPDSGGVLGSNWEGIEGWRTVDKQTM
jgi:hypothetical protein